MKARVLTTEVHYVLFLLHSFYFKPTCLTHHKYVELYQVCIPDSNDEPFCTGTCQPWEWLCRKTNVCIHKSMVCDGYADCDYEEDENALPDLSCPFENSCSESQFRCQTTKKCISLRHKCDGNLDCRDGSDETDCETDHHRYNCDFNSGLCAWSPAGQLQWQISHGETPSDLTGPRMTDDDIINRYLFLEATDANSGESARLDSGILRNAVCVTFSYFLHGADIGTLKITVSDKTEEVEIWSISGDQGQFWQTRSLSINPSMEFYKLSVVAVRGDSFMSDIAIDDLQLSFGECSAQLACSFNDPEACQIKKSNGVGLVWDHDFGTVIPPHLMPPNSEVNFESNQIGNNWMVYDFKVDMIPGCSDDCKSPDSMKLVRKRSLASGGQVFIGVLMCNSYKKDQVKIMMSDKLDGVYRHIKYSTQFDVCELISGKNKWTSHQMYDSCQAELAYQYSHQYGDVSGEGWEIVRNEENFKTISSSFCLGTDLPDIAPQAKEYHYIIAQSWTPASSPKVASFMYPVQRTEAKAYLPGYWCLTVSYSIVFNAQLIISIDGTLIWSSAGISTGPHREQLTINIPEALSSYDLTFTAHIQQGKSGAVLVDEIDISKEACFQRDKSCSFDSPQEDCFFNIDRGQLITQRLDHLYEKGLFEPEIVENDMRPATIITSPDDGSYNFISEPFYIAKPYYDTYCVKFKYKKKSGGVIKIELSLAVGKKSKIVYDKMLRPSSVSPWIEVAVDVEMDQSSMGTLSFHSLPETYLAYMKLENGQCPETTCNGQIMCSNGVNCVDPNQLCDTKNNCGDWSDEIGCESSCGDRSEHYDDSGTLGNKPKHQSCLWRIHGRPGKKILLSITSFGLNNQIDGIWFFYGLQNIETKGGNFIELPKNATGQTKIEYFIDSNEATIIVDFELAEIVNDGNIADLPLIQYKQVDDDWCSHICDTGQCLRNELKL